jgi:hypothetical protein
MPYKHIADYRKYRMRYYYAHHAKQMMDRRLYNWKIQGINLTESGWRDLLEKQDHKCAICGKHESSLKKGLAVDHDHSTGRIRGLLCFTCNRYLVLMFEKYQHLIPKIMEYLNEPVRSN